MGVAEVGPIHSNEYCAAVLAAAVQPGSASNDADTVKGDLEALTVAVAPEPSPVTLPKSESSGRTVQAGPQNETCCMLMNPLAKASGSTVDARALPNPARAMPSANAPALRS
jgi:hypothetical protein